MPASRQSQRVWERGTGAFPLHADDVAVWRATTAHDAESLAGYWAVLDAGEQARASAMRLARQREEFVSAHGMLRTLLGEGLHCSPETIEFAANAQGRPLLVGPDNRDPVFFSLSHSEGLVLLALARVPEIGADVERVREWPDCLRVAEQYFAPAEIAALRTDGRLATFFRCWTRKEAFVKATGRGLSLPFDKFVVTVGEDEPARVVWYENDPAEAARWTLLECDPADDFVGTVAVRLRSPAVRWFDWSI